MRTPIALGSLLVLLTPCLAPGAASAGPDEPTVSTRPATATSLHLDLAAAVRRAFEWGPDLESRREAVEAARFGIDLAEADQDVRFRPSAASGLGSDTSTTQSYGVSLAKRLTTGTELSVTGGSTAADDAFYRSHAGVGLSQSLSPALWTGSGARDVEDARDAVARRESELAEARDAIALDVMTAYLEVVRQQRLLEARQGALDAAATLVEASRARRGVGLATQLDVYRAEHSRAAAEGAVLDARAALADATDRLAHLVGLPPGTPFALDGALGSETFVLHEEPLIERALAGRADLRAIRLETEQAERRLGAARDDLFPDVTVSVSYALVGTGESFSESTHLDEPTVTFGLSSATTFARTAERAVHGQARVAARAARRRLRDAEDRVELEVRRALRSTLRAADELRLQEEALAIAGSRQELAELRYERGIADNLDLVDAQEALASARTARISALIDLKLARARLDRVVGVLADRFTTPEGPEASDEDLPLDAPDDERSRPVPVAADERTGPVAVVVVGLDD